MSLPPYSAYKQVAHDWLASIPAHWSAESLKRHTRIVTGATPSSSNQAFWDGGIAWATPIDLTTSSAGLLTSTARTISEAGMQSCATEPVPAGSVLLSTRAPIGTVALAGIVTCINQGCRALVPRESLNSRFIAYILGAWAAHLGSLGRGSTFLELSTDALGGVKVPIPGQLEQAEIVGFLDRETAKIDALIAEQKRLIALLQEKRQAVISHAVTKGLDPNVPMKDSGVEWMGDVPRHWTVDRLKRHCELRTSNVDKKTVDGQRAVRLCNYTDVYYNDSITDRIAFMDATATDAQIERLSLEPGDVIITKDSESAHDIARSAYVPAPLEGVVCGYHLAILRPRENTSGLFVKYYFDGTLAKAQVAVEANGLTRFALGQYAIDNLVLAWPPPEEQNRIGEFIAKTNQLSDSVVASATAAIDLLRERRTALITAAVTGQIDVRGLVETAA